MTGEEKPKPITREDVESLAEKIEVFAASLTPAERGLLGLAFSNGARHCDRTGAGHGFATPLSKLLAQATSFVEGRLTVPDSIVTINPGKLRAKEDTEFLGFGRK
jgi:hypothetical protein